MVILWTTGSDILPAMMCKEVSDTDVKYRKDELSIRRTRAEDKNPECPELSATISVGHTWTGREVHPKRLCLQKELVSEEQLDAELTPGKKKSA